MLRVIGMTLKRNKPFHSMASIALTVVVPLLAIRRRSQIGKGGNTTETLPSTFSLLIQKVTEILPSIVVVMTGIAVSLAFIIFLSAFLRTKHDREKKPVLQEATNEEILDQLRDTVTSTKNLPASLKCLSILAKRCGEKQKRIQQSKRKGKRGTKALKNAERATHKTDSVEGISATATTIDDTHLERICLHATFLALKYHPSNDEAISASLALLTLISKDESIRGLIRTATKGAAVKTTNTKAKTRTTGEGDDEGDTTQVFELTRTSTTDEELSYSITVPIQAMRGALSRAKDRIMEDHERKAAQRNNHSAQPSVVERQEEISAELQRKGCLFLGAIADENKDMATTVIDAGGLDAILEAMDWFRFHEQVGSWALWSIFILCYDHLGNKGALIRAGGLERICRVMNDVPRSMEVQRHGTAILFDALREVPGSVVNLAQVRAVALNAGVHDAVQSAMANFPQCPEIMMMGQQILLVKRFAR